MEGVVGGVDVVDIAALDAVEGVGNVEGAVAVIVLVAEEGIAGAAVNLGLNIVDGN